MKSVFDTSARAVALRGVAAADVPLILSCKHTLFNLIKLL